MRYQRTVFVAVRIATAHNRAQSDAPANHMVELRNIYMDTAPDSLRLLTNTFEYGQHVNCNCCIADARHTKFSFGPNCVPC